MIANEISLIRIRSCKDCRHTYSHVARLLFECDAVIIRYHVRDPSEGQNEKAGYKRVRFKSEDQAIANWQGLADSNADYRSDD